MYCIRLWLLVRVLMLSTCRPIITNSSSHIEDMNDQIFAINNVSNTTQTSIWKDTRQDENDTYIWTDRRSIRPTNTTKMEEKNVKKAEIYRVSSLIFKCTIALSSVGVLFLLLTYAIHEFLEWYEKLWVHCLEVQHMKEDEEYREGGIRRIKLLQEIIKSKKHDKVYETKSVSADELSTESCKTPLSKGGSPCISPAVQSYYATYDQSNNELLVDYCVQLRQTFCPQTVPSECPTPSSHTASSGSGSPSMSMSNSSNSSH